MGPFAFDHDRERSEQVAEAAGGEVPTKSAGVRQVSDLLIEHAPVALAFFDTQMRYLAVSRAFRHVFGLKDRVLIGESHYDVFPELPGEWKAAHLRALAGESLRDSEDRIGYRGQGVRWSGWEIRPWRHADDSIGGIVMLIESAGLAPEANRGLQLAATLFEHATEGIVVTDLDGKILEINESFVRMTGYPRAELIGKNPRILQSGLQDYAFYVEMWRRIRETGSWQGELWNRTAGGELFAVTSRITTVCDAEGTPRYYIGLLFDITSMKEQERKLENIARYDLVTGLPNRAAACERLQQAMIASRQSGDFVEVVLFDLDGFRQINEIHGREAADGVLSAIVKRLKLVLRDGDMLARVGGDEFVAVLPNVLPGNAWEPMLARLLEAIGQPQRLGDSVVTVTASAGATYFPQHDIAEAEQLMRQADRAMYEAKLAGGNRSMVFDPRRDHSARDHYEEIDRLRRAVRDGELVLHYQPRVNMATGEVVGAEALLRWQHPERGMIPPRLFVPSVQDHEVMIEVGEWVLQTVLKQLDQWIRDGLGISVSLNLGALQLQQVDFVERVRALLAEWPEVPRSLLEFEVLETSAMSDLARVSAVVRACREIGISVAIDDFGTGYSSLSYLKRLPANVLKIDQSFVQGMLEDPDDLAILQGVMGLAEAFHRLPVAEGVESVEHGVILLRHGCRLAQGFAIARPMPAEELPGWISTWKPDPCWKDVRQFTSLESRLLVAETELRAWNRAFEAYMRGERLHPPELDCCECRVGDWLRGEKAGSSGDEPVVRRMERLHRKAHQTASTTVNLKQAGRHREAAALMQTTLGLRERMRRLLKSKIGNGADA